MVGSAEELHELLETRLHSAHPSRIVVVSDQLVRNEAGKEEASALASGIRSMFNAQTTHLLAIVALVDGKARRLTDIDVTVDQLALDPVTLQRALSRVARAAWLKSPPPLRGTLRDDDAVTVRLVRSIDEMNECLRLRFQVYESLGYLEERIANLSVQRELDVYDLHALHLCAVERPSGKLAGTLRLVGAPERRQALLSEARVPRVSTP
jgi:hypothetical protein